MTATATAAGAVAMQPEGLYQSWALGPQVQAVGPGVR